MSELDHIFITNEMTHTMFLSLMAFLLATFLTPIYTYYAYQRRWWKKQRKVSTTGETLEVFNKLHAKKFQRNIPTMAGLIFVSAITVVTMFNLDRGETWLPLAAFIGGAVVGFIDDLINLYGDGSGTAGLRSRLKFVMVTAVGAALGWWFFSKNGVDSVFIPYIGDLVIGWWIIPLFAFAVVATGNAVNISDGLDGLSGGLLSIAYGAFGVIALLQGQPALAGFCFTVIGALLSYVWFNIYPARFFMGDIGSFSLGAALGVVAILTDALLLLPVIGALFVIEAGSSLIQIVSKRFFNRKVFISAPIHHHLEALGWPETKITMRFWVIGAVVAFVGVFLALAGGVVA